MQNKDISLFDTTIHHLKDIICRLKKEDDIIKQLKDEAMVTLEEIQQLFDDLYKEDKPNAE